MKPLLITNIDRLVTMKPQKDREGPLGVIENAALLIEKGRVKWFGPPPAPLKGGGDRINARGGVVIPGLIDCHTHLVHAGSRLDDFLARSRGKTYEEIARAGGGIMSTVRATRAASEKELFSLASERAKESLSHGVTTLEVKSGYGLDAENELKILRVIRRLNKKGPIEFVSTFLGAHICPPPIQSSTYINLILTRMLPAVAKEKLARFCDVFVEDIAFTRDEARQIIKAGLRYGLMPKFHVDQLTYGGGAELAAELGAVSADHLEYISDEGMLALARTYSPSTSKGEGGGVTAVLLPGASFFIGKEYAPARSLVDRGVRVALATDYNPGTSPFLNIWFVAALAINQMGLTPEEAYKGITVNAARALALDKTHGSIAPGKVADLVLLKAASEFEPFYRFDRSFVSMVIKNGRVV